MTNEERNHKWKRFTMVMDKAKEMIKEIAQAKDRRDKMSREQRMVKGSNEINSKLTKVKDGLMKDVEKLKKEMEKMKMLGSLSWDYNTTLCST